MKVKLNTADLLIVEQRPWILGIIFAVWAFAFFAAGIKQLIARDLSGLGFLAGGAFVMVFFYIFVRRVQVVFHRPESWVEIRSRTLTRYDRVRHDLAEIERAIVQSSYNNDGGPTHRVALVIPKGQSRGDHPLTNYYTSGWGADRTSKAINGWLDLGRARA